MTPAEVVAHFSSIAEAARALKVSPPSVSQWIAAGSIPVDRQCQIEIVTGGKLRADRDENGLPVKRDPRSSVQDTTESREAAA